MTIDFKGSLSTLVVGAVLGGFLFMQSCRLRAAQEAGAANALRADSTAAAADTSRMLAADAQRAVEKLFGDSVAAVQRRVIQQQQRADGLDAALGLERIARTTAVAIIDQLTATIASQRPTHVDANDVRTASFALRQLPYTVDATASIPPPPTQAALHIRITLDTLSLQLRLGCGKVDPGGIRPATAVLTGPTWATLALGHVEQAPELCRSPALAQRGPSRLTWFGLGAGTTLLLKLITIVF